MKIRRLTDSVEIIAAFSIVASLIFVGYQIMQDRDIARTEAVVAGAEGRKYMAELIGENKDIWVRGLAGESLTIADKAVFESLADAYDLDVFGSWYRATQLNHTSPDRFPYQYALFLLQNPGLMAHFHEDNAEGQTIRKVMGTEGTGGWNSAIQAAIEDIQKSGVLEK